MLLLKILPPSILTIQQSKLYIENSSSQVAISVLTNNLWPWLCKKSIQRRPFFYFFHFFCFRRYHFNLLQRINKHIQELNYRFFDSLFRCPAGGPSGNLTLAIQWTKFEKVRATTRLQYSDVSFVILTEHVRVSWSCGSSCLRISMALVQRKLIFTFLKNFRIIFAWSLLGSMSWKAVQFFGWLELYLIRAWWFKYTKKKVGERGWFKGIYRQSGSS